MAYATIDDLEKYWHTLTESEEDTASALLDVASIYLDDIVARYHVDTEVYADALTYVCCELVRRKMESAAAVPVSSITQTAGSFSETISYGYTKRQSWQLYDEDLQMLGVKRHGIGGIRVKIHGR